ncbi:deoxyribose-phosphate aldolase [Clostridiales bacterium]|nr:deoxyribose-phosphate aldolase [Clostridiales bacterium]
MEISEILGYIDHTLLKPDTNSKSVMELCRDALRYKTASVCIPPAYVKIVRESFPELNICTVIGFPLGYCTKAVKVFETEDAVKNGADEIDMVINIGDVKNGDFDAITEEISAVKQVAGEKIVKVIIETCYLSVEEKIALCGCVTKAGADFIKTSTGFGTAGAQIEDIELFKRHLGGDVKIKAAGGIRTREDMEKFIAEGCDRIGSSGAKSLFNK